MSSHNNEMFCGSLLQSISRPTTNFWSTGRAKQALANQREPQQRQRPLDYDKDYIALVSLVSWGSKCKQWVSGQHVESRYCSTEFNGAVSEEAKIVAITKIVLSLMKQNGH
jgi:hypothetical protein